MTILNSFIKKNRIAIKGQIFTPRALNLEEAIELILILAPYVGLIEQHFGEFERILKDTSGSRPKLLSSLLTAMVDEIKPADFTKVFAILLHKEPAWFEDVKAVELVNALPVLDRINNFGSLIHSVQKLGLTVRYKDA